MDVELVLLFDQDQARMRMKRTISCQSLSDDDPSSISSVMLPTERNVIQLWERASAEPNTVIVVGVNGSSLSCCCEVVSPHHADTRKNTPKSTSTDKKSKRELLKLLRDSMKATAEKSSDDNVSDETTRMEFLRRWHLNSSDEAILRKVNRKRLSDAWKNWIYISCRNKKLGEDEGGDNKSCNNSSIRDSFLQILKPVQHSSNSIHNNNMPDNQTNKRKHASSDEIPKTIALFLHEDCPDELPCFGLKQRHITRSPDRIYVFLGAVRDITNEEYQSLDAACNNLNIPLVGCNLGRTAEFTSKIISAMICHHNHGVLGGAVARSWKNGVKYGNLGITQIIAAEKPTDSVQDHTKSSNRNSGVFVMHAVSMVPIKSSELSTDVSKRSFALWCIVRLCVCTLWRSRLASSVNENCNSGQLMNVLSIVFQDGLVLRLEQNDLVKSLADKHQAAPSEYQILNALCEKRDSIHSSCSSKFVNWDQTFCEILKEKSQKSDIWRRRAIILLADGEIGEGKQFIRDMYRSKCFCGKQPQQQQVSNEEYNQIVYVCVNLSLSNLLVGKRGSGTNEMVNAFSRFMAKSQIPIHNESIFSAGGEHANIDCLAAYLTILQHLHYHGLLFKGGMWD